MLDLYGIAELSGVYAQQHFVRTRSEPLAIEGDPVDHIVDRHHALGVDHVIWNLGRSYVDFWTDHPLLTRWGQLTREHHREEQLRWGPAGLRMLEDMERRDPLARAIDAAHDRDMPIWGWLCMNRFYANDPGMSNQTRFWHQHHVDMAERYKDGTRDDSRLCYAFSEYQEERLAAVTEAARVTGPRSGRHVHTIVLDFVRQPPVLQYHPRLCRAYQTETGVDPRTVLATDTDRYLPWLRWRADILTDLVRRARAALDQLAAETGIQCALAARITDLGPNINLIEGVDIATLCKEGLIAAIVTSPLNWIRGVWDHDLSPYATLGRQYGIDVIAGVCLNQMTRFHRVAGSVSGVALTRRVQRYQEQGADGIAFYQSESGLEFDGFDQFIPALADPTATKALLSDKDFLARWPVTHLNAAYGLDCHSWFNNFTVDGHTNFGDPNWSEGGLAVGAGERLI